METTPPTEQWQHAIVRLKTVSGLIEIVPSQYGQTISNAQPGWTGLLGVLEHLGADGWQVISVEGVDDNALTGRIWIKRRAKMARVMTAEDVANSVH
jgi:hypothetical protein